MVEGEESGAVCGCVCVLRGAGRSSSDRQADLRSRLASCRGAAPPQPNQAGFALLRTPPLRFLRFGFESGSCAANASFLAEIRRKEGEMRGLLPETPEIGCLICENVNLFGHMQPPFVGRAASSKGKLKIRTRFSSAGLYEFLVHEPGSRRAWPSSSERRTSSSLCRQRSCGSRRWCSQ